MTMLSVDPLLPQDLMVQTHRQGSTVLVVVRGELDIATAPLLDAVLEGLVGVAPELVELDLSGVAFLDSHGLTTLTTARSRLAAAESVLVLRDPSPVVRRVLAICGLDRDFATAGAADG